MDINVILVRYPSSKSRVATNNNQKLFMFLLEVVSNYRALRNDVSTSDCVLEACLCQLVKTY